ncbi:hypothetical protein [Allopusillimonas ginsengisoli]|uniref:hypothetical protein n=1 Tax=Allopusillimonas ginsengisoli TaxID=453575 RepID=UPI001021EB9E|nr:hypothetical protein [Allopusillimonas ginsengisoli]TEA74244.1 hypothetical protein ERE07_18355 [Allopusillimonas ginsengisoli]
MSSRLSTIQFEGYFASELEKLALFFEAGLLRQDNRKLSVNPKRRLFVRGAGMIFDRFLAQPAISTYSRLI